MTHDRLLAALVAHPWAILESKWEAIQALLEVRLRGERLTEAEIRAALGGSPPAQREVMKAGPVAVIPLFGVLSQRMNGLQEMSGGTSTALFTRDVRAALEDPAVQAIALDVDSPGGSLYGLEEAASLIRAGRQQKPIVAVANSLMASAAYWIGSAASQVVGAPGADVGSIGVFLVHRDVSQAAAQEGVKFTVIRAGKYKALGNPYEPLTDEAQARLQARVDQGMEAFVDAVAAGRRVAPGVVATQYGEGELVGGKRALAAGMIDRIATLDETVARLSTPEGRRAVLAAQAQSGTGGTTAQEPATATAQESRRGPAVADEKLRFSLTTL